MKLIGSLRSIGAIAASIFITSLIVEVTEFALVALLNGAPTTDPETYLAIRNRDGLLTGKVGYNCLGGVAGGYLGAWIAGRRPLAHAAVAATIQTALLAAAFLDPTLRLSAPVLAWIAFAVTTTIGTMLGSWLFRRRVQRANVRRA